MGSAALKLTDQDLARLDWASSMELA